jgi:hypothetical protein
MTRGAGQVLGTCRRGPCPAGAGWAEARGAPGAIQAPSHLGKEKEEQAKKGGGDEK